VEVRIPPEDSDDSIIVSESAEGPYVPKTIQT
jgi:hypothetical protein